MDRRIKLAADLTRLVAGSFNAAYKGWGTRERVGRALKQSAADERLSKEHARAHAVGKDARAKQIAVGIRTDDDVCAWAIAVVDRAIQINGGTGAHSPLRHQLITFMAEMCDLEGWFFFGEMSPSNAPQSELWAWEDHLRRVGAFCADFEKTTDLVVRYLAFLIHPLVRAHPHLIDPVQDQGSTITFTTHLNDMIDDLPSVVEGMIQTTYAPELDALNLCQNLRRHLHKKTIAASGGLAVQSGQKPQLKLPTKNRAIPPDEAAQAYLGGSPLMGLLDISLPIRLPDATRFEHMHIVAGSGHGKTQTLQSLILRDLHKVARGDASIIVMDSQSDLINTIASLNVFAPDQPLADRLVLIDPTDLEWPVALNLFDAGLERLDQYGALERERLTNSILELYDFVLGSLLDAGMTQKQTVIFRYITRLLLHIPQATIHTLRELLEDGGGDKYQAYINKLEGSARAFFDNEFNGKEFVATKRQVVRRLYGILENQTMERMFSHPKSKLDLFNEMNAGKVILINTAKDLLKEQGTEILGRFFIALIAQAAQERAVLPKDQRLPTFVYIDEANDYFDRNIGIILSQARKYNVGMVLAHQFLGQLEPRLHEAVAANTSIKFAGGVSAKDARALSSDLRTDAGFIEAQRKLSFAAFVKGQTKRAISIDIEPGQMERQPRMSHEDKAVLRDLMRARYAVHHDALKSVAQSADINEETGRAPDDGSPMPWP